MTGLWSVIVPEQNEVTNLITNPSFETATTGWAAAGGSVAANTTYQRRGHKSLAVTCTTASGSGVYYDALALTSGTTYAFAFDFYGVSGVAYAAYFADTAGTLTAGTSAFTGSGQWTRQVATYAATATANFRAEVLTAAASDTADVFYLDGCGVYALDHDPGHIDGDQDDCWWNGTPHLSTSTRAAGSAAGGEVVNFDDYSYYIREWPGAGMAEVSPLVQEIGGLPGVLDAGEKITERAFALSGYLTASSQADLHSKRKNLINAVKSDRVRDKQQVKLVYSGGNSSRPVRIDAKFIGGLGMGVQDGFAEPVALKFLATNPFWYEDGMEGAVLVYSDTVANADNAIRRVDNSWYAITAFNSWVMALAKSNGNIYLGGYFTAAGDTNGNYVTKWNGSALSSLGTGLNDYCRVLATAPNGDIYAGGYFTSAGGVANTQLIAYWDTSTSAWKSVGGGITTVASTAQRIHALAFDNTGKLYVGGVYTGNSSTDLDNISIYSATGWGSLGTGIPGVVYDLACGPEGYMYIGGDYDSANGDTDCVNICRWTGSAFESLGTGTLGGSSNYVHAICFDDAGNLYIGGDFSSVDGVTAANVAMWNGNKWTALGAGVNALVETLAFQDGLLYAGGQFTSAGGLTLSESVAVWNGSTWAHVPIDYTVNGTYYKILPDGDDLYIAGNFSGSLYSSYQNTITNSGTAISYPKFVFQPSGGTSTFWVRYIKNETTGATLWLNYLCQDGETLTIDTALGKRSVTSSYKGNVIGSALLRNSDFSDFYLLPGANKISVQITIDAVTTVTSYMTWPITHWSLDGSAT